MATSWLTFKRSFHDALIAAVGRNIGSRLIFWREVRRDFKAGFTVDTAVARYLKE